MQFIHNPRVHNDRVFIIEPWHVTNTEGTVVAIIVSFFGAILSQIVQVCRVKLERRQRNSQARFGCWYAASSLIYVPLQGLNYILMLIVMTYDVSLLTAVIAGAGIGYFLTDRWKRNRTSKKQPLLNVKTIEYAGLDETQCSFSSNNNPMDESLSLIKLLQDDADIKETTV